MADTYVDYADLAANETEGVDYSIHSLTPAGATWSSIAIHGGGIEAGSGEMAYHVAVNMLPDLMMYYEFKGLKTSGNSVLHITSTNFDEPIAESVQAVAVRTLSFHGYEGEEFLEETALGGLDLVLKDRVRRALVSRGFRVVDAPLEIGGTDPDNIANRNLSLAGVQIELSNAQRRAFFPGYTTARAVRDSGERTEAFYRYAEAMASVFQGEGKIACTSVNVSRYATIPVSTSITRGVTAHVSTDKLATGGSHFALIVGRFVDTSNWYGARLEFTTSQTVVLSLRKRVANTETLLVSKTMTNLTHAVNTKFAFRLRASGTTLNARAWLASELEPSEWDLTTTDSDLSANGFSGIRSILSSTNTNTLPVTYSWDNFVYHTITQLMHDCERSVNGVVKSHAADSPVKLAYPSRVAL